MTASWGPAATSIQTIVRGYIARKRFLKIRKGFIRLQALFRGFLTRKKMKKMNDSAHTIQKRYRGFQKTKQEREDFLNLKKASEVIQKEWRRFKFRNGIE